MIYQLLSFKLTVWKKSQLRHGEPGVHLPHLLRVRWKPLGASSRGWLRRPLIPPGRAVSRERGGAHLFCSSVRGSNSGLASPLSVRCGCKVSAGRGGQMSRRGLESRGVERIFGNNPQRAVIVARDLGLSPSVSVRYRNGGRGCLTLCVSSPQARGECCALNKHSCPCRTGDRRHTSGRSRLSLEATLLFPFPSAVLHGCAPGLWNL